MADQQKYEITLHRARTALSVHPSVTTTYALISFAWEERRHRNDLWKFISVRVLEAIEWATVGWEVAKADDTDEDEFSRNILLAINYPHVAETTVTTYLNFQDVALFMPPGSDARGKLLGTTVLTQLIEEFSQRNDIPVPEISEFEAPSDAETRVSYETPSFLLAKMDLAPATAVHEVHVLPRHIDEFVLRSPPIHRPQSAIPKIEGKPLEDLWFALPGRTIDDAIATFNQELRADDTKVPFQRFYETNLDGTIPVPSRNALLVCMRVAPRDPLLIPFIGYSNLRTTTAKTDEVAVEDSIMVLTQVLDHISRFQTRELIDAIWIGDNVAVSPGKTVAAVAPVAKPVALPMRVEAKVDTFNERADAVSMFLELAKHGHVSVPADLSGNKIPAFEEIKPIFDEMTRRSALMFDDLMQSNSILRGACGPYNYGAKSVRGRLEALVRNNATVRRMLADAFGPDLHDELTPRELRIRIPGLRLVRDDDRSIGQLSLFAFLDVARGLLRRVDPTQRTSDEVEEATAVTQLLSAKLVQLSTMSHSYSGIPAVDYLFCFDDLQPFFVIDHNQNMSQHLREFLRNFRRADLSMQYAGHALAQLKRQHEKTVFTALLPESTRKEEEQKARVLRRQQQEEAERLRQQLEAAARRLPKPPPARVPPPPPTPTLEERMHALGLDKYFVGVGSTPQFTKFVEQKAVPFDLMVGASSLATALEKMRRSSAFAATEAARIQREKAQAEADRKRAEAQAEAKREREEKFQTLGLAKYFGPTEPSAGDEKLLPKLVPSELIVGSASLGGALARIMKREQEANVAKEKERQDAQNKLSGADLATYFPEIKSITPETDALLNRVRKPPALADYDLANALQKMRGSK